MIHIPENLHTFKPKFKDSFHISGNRRFWFFKRLFDLVVSIALIPGLIATCIVAFALNPFLNKGSLFYIQTRMGRDCHPFQVFKLRTMSHAQTVTRGHDDPIEVEKITRLGRFLRETRLDELPQILNVIRGDMSLIGPRPDFYEHAQKYHDIIPGYKDRHQVRPGISGLTQVSLGYAEGITATHRKTHADHYYISNANFRMDTKIVLLTLLTVTTRSGV